jgi:LPXTG-site transpeptidase (sortase) family protein
MGSGWRRGLRGKGHFYTFSAMGATALLVGLVGALYGSGAILRADPAPTATPTRTSTPTATSTPTLTPTATPVPTRPPPVTGISIPSIGVNASIVELGIAANGYMIAPSGPYEVAWYTFSALPGEGGNAVFAGHVDWVTVGPAVFYSLDALGAGDEVHVRTSDGKTHRYGVVSNRMYYAASAPLSEIVGRTPTESVTLITCGGTFNYSTHEYDQRTVVRAERIP